VESAPNKKSDPEARGGTYVKDKMCTIEVCNRDIIFNGIGGEHSKKHTPKKKGSSEDQQSSRGGSQPSGGGFGVSAPSSKPSNGLPKKLFRRRGRNEREYKGLISGTQTLIVPNLWCRKKLLPVCITASEDQQLYVGWYVEN